MTRKEIKSLRQLLHFCDFFLQVQLVHKQRKHCDIEWSFPRDYVTHQDWNSLEFGTTTSYLTAAFATWVSYVAHAHVQNYLCAWTSQLTAAVVSLLVKFVTLSILESCYIFDVQWSNTQSWLLAYYLLSYSYLSFITQKLQKQRS